MLIFSANKTQSNKYNIVENVEKLKEEKHGFGIF